ncbi:hypothetical protein EVAR_27523_1 [Eumeta japonica]|uniref:Uncharacterized protein n=1 Tax=Eumeta variegata TaxID=151549 RepID=A0A4C1W2T7_EUMVA|nr:hypothetical protein EVAR_27523_1 [Eumeta japonica]
MDDGRAQAHGASVDLLPYKLRRKGTKLKFIHNLCNTDKAPLTRHETSVTAIASPIRYLASIEEEGNSLDTRPKLQVTMDDVNLSALHTPLLLQRAVKKSVKSVLPTFYFNIDTIVQVIEW